MGDGCVKKEKEIDKKGGEGYMKNRRRERDKRWEMGARRRWREK